MEVVIALIYLMVPIQGLLLVGIINERRRNARIVKEIWRLRGRRMP